MITNTRIACLSGGRHLIAALVAVAGLALLAVPASAQISRRQATDPLLYPDWVQGSANAWDPVHNVYLVVGASSNTTEPVWAVFTDVNGNPVTGPMPVSGGGVYPQYPSVVYSPNLPNGSGGMGAFLVTWHENDSGASNYVNTRVVAYPSGAVGAQQTILSPTASFWLTPPVVAYSSTSNVFLVVWRGMDTFIWGVRLNGSGATLGAPFPISPLTQSWQNPSLAWNSATDQFGVLYTGYGGPGGTQTAISLVTASGSVVGTNVFNTNGLLGTFVTAIDYNPSTGHFVGVWYQGRAGTMGAEFASDGTVVAEGLVSTVTGTPDTVSLGYNPVSGTFLLAAEGPSYNIWGAELNARGSRDSADTEVTSTGGPKGAFYPMVHARGVGTPDWNISFAHNFNELHDQIVTTTSTGGGPAGALGSAPAGQSTSSGGGSTSSGGCPGSAPFPGAVCVNGGWVPGSGGGTSTGGGSTSSGGCPGTAPFPGAICSNGGWVPGSGGGTSTGGGTSSGGCPGTAPFPGAVCANGGWVPGSGGSTSTGGSTSSGGCPGTAPFPGAVCANGGWVPGSGGSTSAGGSTSGSGCPGSAPFPGAVCVNGGWVPGSGSSASGGSTSGSGCPGSAPFPGAVCVNGGWVPGSGSSASGGSTSGSGCPGGAPFSGAVCVNGGWVPGSGNISAGSTSGSGCPGAAPFSGAVCVNGGWVPGGGTSAGSNASTGGCAGSAPFSGAVCVSGGWVPGGSTSASSGGCLGSAPFPGAVCVSGGWIPGSSASTCSTPDPFTAIGGGTCVNGGWFPPSANVTSGGGTCATPDPFTALGGGVCLNGGWRPQGF